MSTNERKADPSCRELHLHSQLGDLRELLLQTKNEPRLKGPFAFEFYDEVLLSCERMVDRLHSMRCVTTRDEWLVTSLRVNKFFVLLCVE